jgi:nucleotide-binding universal stress UspA family protein
MTLLVPIDIYDEHSRAVTAGGRIAGALDEDVVLFNWADQESESIAAKAHLEQLAKQLGGKVDVELAVTEDRSAAPSIVAAAERRGATICMATHGRSGIGHALLGSVAEETLRLGRRPVILVGPHSTGEAPEAPEPKLIVTVDGSEVSEAALPVAKEWGARLGRPVQVVQVIDPASLPVDGTDVAETSYVARTARDLHAPGPPDFEVLHGDHPAEAIVDHARYGVEMIVMATHGRGGLPRAVLGSVAMRVVHDATCPVLVVPAID